MIAMLTGTLGALNASPVRALTPYVYTPSAQELASGARRLSFFAWDNRRKRHVWQHSPSGFSPMMSDSGRFSPKRNCAVIR